MLALELFTVTHDEESFSIRILAVEAGGYAGALFEVSSYMNYDFVDEDSAEVAQSSFTSVDVLYLRHIWESTGCIFGKIARLFKR